MSWLFSDKAVEDQRGKVTCSRSHSQWAAEKGTQSPKLLSGPHTLLALRAGEDATDGGDCSPEHGRRKGKRRDIQLSP